MEPPTNQVPDTSMVQAHATVQSGTVQNTHNDAHSSQTPSAANHQQVSTPISSAPLTAESDESTISQEWIEKAKEIVAKTSEDPYMQSNLLVQLRAQYLATRFGKQAAKADEDK